MEFKLLNRLTALVAALVGVAAFILAYLRTGV